MSETAAAMEKVANAPKPYMKGRFNLYHAPDGGIHVAYQQDDEEETHHLDIPGPILRAAEMAASGNLSPSKLMGIMTGLLK